MPALMLSPAKPIATVYLWSGLKYLCRCPHSPFAEAGLAANDCISKARASFGDGDELMPSGAGRGCVRKERVN